MQPQGQAGAVKTVPAKGKVTATRKRRGIRFVRLPQVVVNFLLVAVVVLIGCIVMLLGAYTIQRHIIGKLDRKLNQAETQLAEEKRLNETWEANFHIWVNQRVTEELAEMQKTPPLGPPPIAAAPEEEGTLLPDKMSDDEVLARVIAQFGSSEESGPGR